MERSSPETPARLWMILCYLAALFTACFTFAAEPLPFWTEKSTYVEGDKIFAVGIPAAHSDIAQSRQEAFDRASLELMNMSGTRPLPVRHRKVLRRRCPSQLTVGSGELS